MALGIQLDRFWRELGEVNRKIYIYNLCARERRAVTMRTPVKVFRLRSAGRWPSG
jgi:hypothetical protein